MYIVPFDSFFKVGMKSEMRSESDGESEVEGKIITCQRQDCEVKRVNYEDVSARFIFHGAYFCDFSFSGRANIFAAEYAPSNTGTYAKNEIYCFIYCF